MTWGAANVDAKLGLLDDRMVAPEPPKLSREERKALSYCVATIPRPQQRPRNGLIDLTVAPSAMEQAAAGWRR